MKVYRFILVLLILAVAGYGAWYLCRGTGDTDPASEGTLVERFADDGGETEC